MSTVSIRIPSQLARLYGTESWEQVEAVTVAEAIAALDDRFPGLAERLTEPESGGSGSRTVRRWINIFVDERDVRSLQGLQTPLRPGQDVFIVPSVAGGQGSTAPS